MSILSAVSQTLNDLRETYDWITSLDDWEHFAGDSGALRGAARHWRSEAAALRNLKADLAGGLRAHVSFGAAGNWNDDASRQFQSFMQRYGQGLDEVAAEFDRIAGSLEDTAGQVDNFNSTLKWTMIEIGGWIAATLLLMAVPVVGEAEEAAAVVEGTRLVMVVRRVVTAVMDLLRLLKAALTTRLGMLQLLKLTLRTDLVRTFVFSLGALYTARFVEHGILNPGHDPTKGWGPNDVRQMNLDAAFGAVVSVGLAKVDFVEWLPYRTTLNMSNRASFAVESFIESPLIGAVGTGTWAAFNHAVFQGTIQKQGWGTYWKDVGLAALAGGAGGLAAGTLRAGYALRVGALTSADFTRLSEFEVPGWLAPFPALAGRVVRTPLELTVPGIARSAALQGGVGVAPPLVAGATPLGRVPVGGPPQHLIVPGDNLWNIAQGQYGSGTYYRDIARRNHLANPNLVVPGQQLVLPPVDRRHPAPPQPHAMPSRQAAPVAGAGHRRWIPPLSGARRNTIPPAPTLPRQGGGS
jgi:LysM repeat protein/uncharacterized protein YukE